jgi:hypothetical protein
VTGHLGNNFLVLDGIMDRWLAKASSSSFRHELDWLDG